MLTHKCPLFPKMPVSGGLSGVILLNYCNSKGSIEGVDWTDHAGLPQELNGEVVFQNIYWSVRDLGAGGSEDVVCRGRRMRGEERRGG